MAKRKKAVADLKRADEAMSENKAADEEMADKEAEDEEMADKEASDAEMADKEAKKKKWKNKKAKNKKAVEESDDEDEEEDWEEAEDEEESDDEESYDDDEGEDWEVCTKPNPMWEVFGIIYQGGDEVEPPNQLGWINLHSPSGLRYIYKVQMVKEDMESIKHGDEIAVMAKGPIRYDSENVALEFDIFGGAYKGLINNQISGWYDNDLRDACFKPINLSSMDNTGRIVLLMGFYPHAMVAKVEVTLLSNVSNNSACDVYGVVAASNNKLDIRMCTSILFLKEHRKSISVGTDGVILLTRSHVAVPFKSHLYIDISLHVDGYNHTAHLEFPSLKLGDKTEVDEKKNFKVKVDWDVFYDNEYSSDKDE